jgi:hypothetical protein
MIVAEIFAGLGNQLFQYAAARAVAERLRVPLKLNVQPLAGSTTCTYDLDKFNITAALASPAEVEAAVSLPAPGLRQNLHRVANRLRPPARRRSIVREVNFHFEDELRTATKNCYLFGHWQSEKYFKGIEPIIRAEFTLAPGVTEDRPNLVAQIGREESVSLIIRRGDFLQYDHLNLYGDNLGYYYQAIECIRRRTRNPHFFIFSDDIAWVKEHLRLEVPHTFVSEPYPGERYKINARRHQDLLLISRCRHHIITNSTFAWWGAWLGTDPAKVVVAPRRWFKEGTRWYNGTVADTKDVLPESWIKL